MTTVETLPSSSTMRTWLMGLRRTTFREGNTLMENVLLDSRVTLLSIIVKATHSSDCGDVFGGMVSLTELAMKSCGAAK